MNTHEIPDISSALGTQALYVVTTADGYPCKVGITDDPVRRMYGLQNGNWIDLRPAAFFFPYKVSGHQMDFVTPRLNTVRKSTIKMEILVHRKMKDLDLHIRGEWFAIAAEDAIAVCEKVAEQNEFRLVSPEDMMKLDPQAFSRRADGEAAVEILNVSIGAIKAMRSA